MAASQQSPDPVVAPADPIDSLNTLTRGAEGKSAGVENLKEQVPLTKDERIVSPNVPHDANSIDPARNVSGQLGYLDVSGDNSAVYQPNIYAPQAQAIYYGGYENTTGGWDEYSQYLNPEGLDLGSHGNASLMFHTGYGYSPQMPYGPYSPVTTPLPSGNGDNQLYSTQQFQYTGPYFQHPVPHSMPYLSSPTAMSQADVTVPVGMDQQGAYLADANSNGMLFRPRPSYPVSHGSFGRGSFTGNSGNPSFYDLRQGFDGFGSGGLGSDWLKSPDGQRSLTPLSSPAASPQPIGARGMFGRSVTPIASGMAPQQQRPYYGFGSSINSYDRGYLHGNIYHQGVNFGSSLGMNSRGWITVDKGRRRGKSNAAVCSCNGALDFLSEQNRGPRATRPKNLATEQNSSNDNKNDNPTAGVDHELYNKPDFVTEYKDAKFFIIKSYSEDNVHKSIKYGVWASTPNGNRKLDAAYHEAKEKGADCPVFLFFSVNASAQFCGVAEMIGPVDFEKSVDYWQQDKWSGQFPVKWHIIKDVPNSIFRHIILENNDNKPVTNSRDTQEVKLEQGLEMLNLFKKHDSELSILDDFDFYEERQKAMQERKVRQQQEQQQQQSYSMAAFPLAAGVEQHNPAPVSGEFVSQMSKSFAEAVRLVEESSKDDPTTTTEKSIIMAATAAKPVDPTKPAKETTSMPSS